MANEKGEKKIIVDEDWKQQAKDMKAKDAASTSSTSTNSGQAGQVGQAKDEVKEEKGKIEEQQAGPSTGSPSTSSGQVGQAEQVGQAGERQLPPGDFAGLVNILVSQSLFLLGMLDEKGQEAREPDLPLAKYHIDMLVALEAKTKGNLNNEEDKMLQSVLQQLRMAYVDLSSKAGESAGEK